MQEKLAVKRHVSKMMVLMTMPTPIHSVTGTLDLPRGNADRGVRAKEILTGCTSNAYVTVAGPEMTAMQGRWALYNSANTSNRKARWRAVKNDLEDLMGRFQTKANSDPANAIEILRSGKFGIKNVNPRQNQYFHAENTAVSGTVEIFAEGGGEHTCHDWMFSPDNETWERMVPTMAGYTTKSGLTRLTTVYFKHQIISKNGPEGFDNVIEILVY